MNEERWKQRFQNFLNAFEVFERIKNKSLEDGKLDEIEQMALIQSFEFLFELAWKTLKDYLNFQGYQEVASPREVIKNGFEGGYLKNAETWLKALLDRNQTTHIYDEEKINEISQKIINEYYEIFKDFKETFEGKK